MFSRNSTSFREDLEAVGCNFGFSEAVQLNQSRFKSLLLKQSLWNLSKSLSATQISKASQNNRPMASLKIRIECII